VTESFFNRRCIGRMGSQHCEYEEHCEWALTPSQYATQLLIPIKMGELCDIYRQAEVAWGQGADRA
jgi:hypothetical protein